MNLSTLELVAALVAVFAGACLQGSLGFGLGLVAAPVLVLVDTSLVPAVVLGIGVPLTYLVAWRERRSLRLRPVAWAIAGRVPGTIIGSMAVLAFSQRALAAVFAVALLVAVLLSVVSIAVRVSPTSLFWAGFGSGAMGTATSVGGPPMALLLQRAPGPDLRAALGAFMAFGSTLSLLTLAVVGEFDRDDLTMTLVLLPAVIGGFIVSRWTNRILDRGYTRPAVLTFATLSALSILARQVF